MENIFDVTTDDIPTMDENVDYVEQLVGEGKKFRDLQGLARGKAEADATIEMLKKKADELQQELKTRMTFADLLTELKGNKAPQQEDVVTPPSEPQHSKLDDSDIETRLEKILAEREAKKTHETNVEKVKRVMIEQFGDDTSLVIKKKAQELNMSPADLQDLAVRSPSAFFSLVGVAPERSGDSFSAPRNQVNLGNQQTGVRNAKYYEQMKRVDSKKYFSNETTTQMIKDRATLGAKFYQ